MQLEDLKIIQTTSSVALTDKIVVALADSKTPKAVTVGDFLETAIGELPTADPEVVGALFVGAGGVLTVSAGA
jgi:hypothetical protein